MTVSTKLGQDQCGSPSAYSGSYDHTIRLWDVVQGVCVSTFLGHRYSVNALAVLPNGLLASGSADETIKLWDVSRGVCVSTLEEHWDNVNALVMLANGFLVSGSMDTRIKLWDVTSGECVVTFRDKSLVMALAVLSSSLLTSLLASGSEDKTIKLWKVDFSPVVIPGNVHELSRTTSSAAAPSAAAESKAVEGVISDTLPEAQALDQTHPSPLYAGSEPSFFSLPALPTSTSAVNHVVASEKKG